MRSMTSPLKETAGIACPTALLLGCTIGLAPCLDRFRTMSLVTTFPAALGQQ